MRVLPHVYRPLVGGWGGVSPSASSVVGWAWPCWPGRSPSSANQIGSELSAIPPWTSLHKGRSAEGPPCSGAAAKPRADSGLQTDRRPAPLDIYIYTDSDRTPVLSAACTPLHVPALLVCMLLPGSHKIL